MADMFRLTSWMMDDSCKSTRKILGNQHCVSHAPMPEQAKHAIPRTQMSPHQPKCNSLPDNTRRRSDGTNRTRLKYRATRFTEPTAFSAHGLRRVPEHMPSPRLHRHILYVHKYDRNRFQVLSVKFKLKAQVDA